MTRKPRKRKRKPKRKSGNGTNGKQWLYFLINIPMIFVVKIGITGSLWSRISSIDKDNYGWDIPIFVIPVYGAYWIEQTNKRLCKSMQVNFFSGTGKTERFWIPAMFPALILAILAFVGEWVFYCAVGFFIFWTFLNWPT